jgi:hypothetical protein
LSPRDIWAGVAQLALAIASYTAREYPEAVHWAELEIQSQPAAPIRRAIMIACCAWAGDMQRAAQERAVLDGFASLFRGENRVFTRPEDMDHLLRGLRLAAGGRRDGMTGTRRLAYSRLMGEGEEGTLQRLESGV